MTEVQEKNGRRQYLKKWKALQPELAEIKDPNKLEEILKELAWNSFSNIATQSKKTNKIYVLISCSDITNQNGQKIDRIYTFMDLENGIRAVRQMELGNFYREKNKQGKQANIVIDPQYCSGLNAYIEERKKFFLALARSPQEEVVNWYRRAKYLDELPPSIRHKK